MSIPAGATVAHVENPDDAFPESSITILKANESEFAYSWSILHLGETHLDPTSHQDKESALREGRHGFSSILEHLSKPKRSKTP